jgi:hypothetical protein
VKLSGGGVGVSLPEAQGQALEPWRATQLRDGLRERDPDTSPHTSYSFGRRSSATGVPSALAIASGGQGPAQLSRAPSIVIVVPE